jgi:hypothetical protein
MKAVHETIEEPQEKQEKPAESLYDVVRIPVNHISAIWSYVFPLLDQSRNINPLMTMDQIIEGLADESLQLWVVIRNDPLAQLAAAFLTGIERDRGEWVLSLHNLFGPSVAGLWGARHWAGRCHEAMHQFAALQDCTRVRLCGRKAWQRILPGYAVVGEKGGHLIYERRVT